MEHSLKQFTRLFLQPFYQALVGCKNELRRHPEFRFDLKRHVAICPRCGRRIEHEDILSTHLVSVDRPGRQWPDVIQNETLMTWIVSDKVASDIQDAGLAGYEIKPFTFPKFQHGGPRMNYYLLLSTGKVKINVFYVGGSCQKRCEI